ncbi:CLUMA_CG015521, isoform A [Clunio marinus]|uniref:CLUMA_CG015521, isoform A n=1 Tax=Clunio marinus TaxID=568069 RepID=A0A1J1IPJ2_9DIPT|nr:CLUMA_CG015521, isoform A [Clunio marinus]
MQIMMMMMMMMTTIITTDNSLVNVSSGEENRNKSSPACYQQAQKNLISFQVKNPISRSEKLCLSRVLSQIGMKETE